ncbi:MAG: hypothetical protein MZV63_41165 [Marinilabiliales bacterium]|nr:hypothetical protein [Marinilabiliales bacterium]
MIIKAIVRQIVAAVLILQVTAACVRNPYEVNVSAIECDLSVRNLAGEIFETSPPDLSARAETLKEEYGRALTTYSTVIGLGDPSDEKWESAFILFCHRHAESCIMG